MKKKKRIHHHAANKIRAFLSTKNVEAKHHEANEQPPETTTEQHKRNGGTGPFGQAEQQTFNGERAAEQGQRQNGNSLPLPPRRNQISRFSNWRYLKVRKWRERWPILIAFLTAVFIFWQAYIYNEQRKIMNKQREVMDAQLGTMNGQLESMNKTLAETKKGADAAVKASDAAKDSASAANAAVDQNKELIKAAKVQASTSQTAARAAAISAEIAQESQRPSLGIFESTLLELGVGKAAHAKFTLRNTGSIPAQKVRAVTTGWLDTQSCPEIPPIGVVVGIPSEASIPVNGERISNAFTGRPITEADMKLIDAGTQWFYVYIRAEYEGRRGHRYAVEYYGRYNKGVVAFDLCTSHNGSN